MFFMTTGITLQPGRLAEKRKAANLSQEGLAALVRKRLGDPTFHQTNISGYERGIKTPSLPVFRALAKVLETNMEWLAGETDDDKPASDLEDQVVVGIDDPEDRAMMQDMMNLLAAAGSDERRYVAGLVRRLLTSARQPVPRIIGDE